MSKNIFKIWGERRRILLTDTIELDLLYLKKDSFCSWHLHRTKINLFTVIKGKVKIETEYGEIILKKNDNFEVYPFLKHRFIALTNATMIEVSYVKKGKINEKDIKREVQGGLIINGEYLSIPELRKKGLLNK